MQSRMMCAAAHCAADTLDADFSTTTSSVLVLHATSGPGRPWDGGELACCRFRSEVDRAGRDRDVVRTSAMHHERNQLWHLCVLHSRPSSRGWRPGGLVENGDKSSWMCRPESETLA